MLASPKETLTLNLYIQIDDGLAQRLIEKALQNADLQIQEVGEDFGNYLKTFVRVQLEGQN